MATSSRKRRARLHSLRMSIMTMVIVSRPWPGAPGQRKGGSGKVQRGANAGLDIGRGQSASQFVSRAPAGTVPRHNDTGSNRLQFGDGTRDNRLEDGAAEMQAADKGVDGLDAGKPPGMLKNVDDPGVAAAREDHQAAVFEMADNSLIIPDPDIGLPAVVGTRLLQGEAFFKIGDALNLTGHQHGSIEQQRGTSFFDDGNTFAIEIGLARWGHMDFGAGWEDDASVAPGIGMEQQGQTALPQTAYDAL